MGFRRDKPGDPMSIHAGFARFCIPTTLDSGLSFHRERVGSIPRKKVQVSNWFKRLIGFLFPYTRLPKDPDADIRRIPGYCQRPDIECCACEWPDCISLKGKDRKAACCHSKSEENA